jgi:hypothetical protein
MTNFRTLILAVIAAAAINRGVAAKEPNLQPHLQPNNLEAHAGSDQCRMIASGFKGPR